MADATGLTLDYEPIGRNGLVRVTARLPDGTAYTDKIDVARACGRERFLRGLCKGREGIDPQAVAAELERIAGEVVAGADEGGKEEEEPRRRASQADILVGLATTAELFHTPGGHDSESFASFKVSDHKETWPINGNGFRRWLSRLFWVREKGKVPGSQALQDAINVIAGKALHDGPEHAVAVRVAEQGGWIWLDLADESWQAVQISAEGWKVVADPPVKFVRRRGMLSLPVPVGGGSVDELRSLVNLPDDDDWVLFVAWLVAALRPGRPFPVLCVNGRQGSAKSTLCRVARALLDPNKAALRRPPREDRDLMIAATNSWVVAFDNLSGIHPTLSDALCLLATGGGFGTRQLYTDDDEKLFDAVRPVMLNGIEDIATRADLLDRAVNLMLPEIPDDRRRDEDDLWRHFEEARARILGGLLDAVSTALRNRDSVRLPSKPRMADFACWVVAAEPALPWPAGTFLRAYFANRTAGNALALEASIVAPAVLSLLEKRDHWHGTARELLDELERHHADEKTRKRKEWPTSPRKLSSDLRRLAPNLSVEGISVIFGARTKKGTQITLERAGKTSSPPSPPSPALQNKDLRGDGLVTVGEGHVPQPSSPNPLLHKGGDGGDGGDGQIPVCSNSVVEDSELL